MNYWPRWISAIRKRTMHLSLAQMGAYDRLLDHYYAEEKPLPGSLEACCRIAGAVTKAEREAVASVLAEFFTLEGAGYSNTRAEEEIALALPKIAAAQANGKRGGRPKKPKEKPNGFPPGNPPATQDEPTAKAPHPHTPTVSYDTSGAAREDESPEVKAATAYGSIARSLRLAGIEATPGHPKFRALVDAGATAEEFGAFVDKAKAKDAPFAYLLSAVEGERTRAAQMALHQGPMEKPPAPSNGVPTTAEADRWLAEHSAIQSTPEVQQAAVAALKALRGGRLTA